MGFAGSLNALVQLFLLFLFALHLSLVIMCPSSSVVLSFGFSVSLGLSVGGGALSSFHVKPL